MDGTDKEGTQKSRVSWASGESAEIADRIQQFQTKHDYFWKLGVVCETILVERWSREATLLELGRESSG
jgi:hypothetical protein